MLDLAQGADLRAIVFDERIMRLTVKAKRRIVGELFSTKKEFYAYIAQCLADYADLMFRNFPKRQCLPRTTSLLPPMWDMR